MTRVVRLAESLRREIVARAVEAYPNEACGLLIGTQAADGMCVTQVFAVRNVSVARAADRFELAPEDYLAAESFAAAVGEALVGIWHSHPDHPARPSATDREWAWAGWSYIIAAVVAGRMIDLRSWRLDGEGAFVEERIEEEPS